MSNMKSVVAAAAITLASGRLELTAAQATSRKHSLKKIKVNKEGDGLFEIQVPVQFKAGEKFGYDGEVPKSMLDVFVDPKEVAARERAKAEALQEERRAIGVEVRADVCTRIRAAMAAIEMPNELRGKVLEAVNAAEAA